MLASHSQHKSHKGKIFAYGYSMRSGYYMKPNELK